MHRSPATSRDQHSISQHLSQHDIICTALAQLFDSYTVIPYIAFHSFCTYVDDAGRKEFNEKYMNVNALLDLPITPHADGRRFDLRPEEPLVLPPFNMMEALAMAGPASKPRNWSPLKQAMPAVPSSPSPFTSTAAAIPNQETPSAVEGAGSDIPAGAVSAEVSNAFPSKCSGPMCSAVSDPGKRLKRASQCTYTWCKRCCVQHQNETGASCKLGDHRNAAEKLKQGSTSTSTPANRTAETSGAVAPLSLYHGPKPLKPAHYEARKRAFAETEQTIHRVAEERKELERIDGICVEIRYYSKDSANEPIILTATFATYPSCRLSFLCDDEKSILGITSDTTIRAMFYPATGSWKLHKVSIPYVFADAQQRGSGPPVLLIRDHDAPRTLSITAAEQELALNYRKRAPNRKLPIEIPDSDSSENEQTGNKRTVEDAFGTVPPPLERPQKQQRKLENHAVPRTTQSAPSKATATRKVALPDGIPDVRRLERERASAHGEWPLKYFIPMERGLQRIADPHTSNLIGRLPQKFRQVFDLEFKKTAYHKHMNTFKYAPSALRDHFRSAGYSDRATWKIFRDVVSDLYKDDPYVLRRLNAGGSGKGGSGKGGSGKGGSGKECDDTEDRTAEPTQAAIEGAEKWIASQTPSTNPISSLKFQDISVDADPATEPTGSVCGFCSEVLPGQPSDSLKAMHHQVTSGSAPALLEARYCQQHQAESLRERQVDHLRWPATVDFSGLGDRVEAFEDVLYEIWLDPSPSQFYTAFLERVKVLGTYNKAASMKGDKDHIGAGYYGEKGLTIISNVLQLLFDESAYCHKETTGMSYIDFLWTILIPETLTCLVQDDLGDATPEDVVKVIQLSGPYGQYLHPEDESDDGVEYQRRLAERSVSQDNLRDGIQVEREQEDFAPLALSGSACPYTSITDSNGNEVLVIDD
ncbi:hypothetical protein D9611_010673 [Ephemerocybe angulata]|uniref:Restriction of telomere capping protein 4 n=1 Tax=Ephemerocybe angulata TaxID=980116 RepID=A0A8H5F1Y3_9AGAR|nr:hypothetical protein D9611_010673 [Tulosesus angulatus]